MLCVQTFVFNSTAPKGDSKVAWKVPDQYPVQCTYEYVRIQSYSLLTTALFVVSSTKPGSTE